MQLGLQPRTQEDWAQWRDARWCADRWGHPRMLWAPHFHPFLLCFLGVSRDQCRVWYLLGGIWGDPQVWGKSWGRASHLGIGEDCQALRIPQPDCKGGVPRRQGPCQASHKAVGCADLPRSHQGCRQSHHGDVLGAGCQHLLSHKRMLWFSTAQASAGVCALAKYMPAPRGLSMHCVKRQYSGLCKNRTVLGMTGFPANARMPRQLELWGSSHRLQPSHEVSWQVMIAVKAKALQPLEQARHSATPCSRIQTGQVS